MSTNHILCVGLIMTVAGLPWPSLAAEGASAKEPVMVDPGSASTQEKAGQPPSDAIVLFAGQDLSKWRQGKDSVPKWIVKDDTLLVTQTGNIFTREEFGDCQLHVEWSAPTPPKGEGQGRGNSGVYLQGRYEIQVLDSWNNKTYFNGQAGAIYTVSAPLVNPIRKPGEWNIYDIVFHAPKAGPDGRGVIPGTFTVFFNGVLVQDHVAIRDATVAAAFSGPVAKGPLMLQDHSNPVRYRNIWIRPL